MVITSYSFFLITMISKLFSILHWTVKIESLNFNIFQHPNTAYWIMILWFFFVLKIDEIFRTLPLASSVYPFCSSSVRDRRGRSWQWRYGQDMVEARVVEAGWQFLVVIFRRMAAFVVYDRNLIQKQILIFVSILTPIGDRYVSPRETTMRWADNNNVRLN